MLLRRVIAVALISLFFLSGLYIRSLAHKKEGIWHVSGGEMVSFDSMIEDLKSTKLVFMGEYHDSESHHDAQLKLIKELNDEGAFLAIGLEMFRANSQSSLDEWVSGTIEENAFREVFQSNWGSYWPLYKKILIYAKDNGIPLIGLNVPREIPRKVARYGFASLTPEEMRQLPGVSCNVDPEYEAFIRRALGGHGKHGPSFINFCEAQMVWDTTMAHNLLNYQKNNPKRTIVVLAGSGHSWKRGIPEQVRRNSEVSYRVVLPEIPDRMHTESVTHKDADYLWVGI